MANKLKTASLLGLAAALGGGAVVRPRPFLAADFLAEEADRARADAASLEIQRRAEEKRQRRGARNRKNAR